MPTPADSNPLDLHTKSFLAQADSSPFDFHSVSTKAVGDERLRLAVSSAVTRQHNTRQLSLLALPDSDKLRALAGEIKQHALDHLDYYLEQLESKVQSNGGQVHFAADAAEARNIILNIAKANGCVSAVKSKSMTTEEIHLNAALQQAGIDIVESDLGEFIVQISNDKPSHIVGPIVHKDLRSIAKIFADYFGTSVNEDPAALTRQARTYLRGKFRRADLGITGGNFLVAETGQVCVVENEGNARQSITTPRVLVSLVGIEKVIPRLEDLSVLLKLLGRSATGQHLTVYTNLFGSPRKPDETDGPEQFHLVLLDNGRSEILAGPYRETLRCIRCGACLNACPVYRGIGGHAYGHVYSGPIGALIAPLFQGLGNFKDLPQASTLCGACYEACPVKINIPQHLVNMRRDLVTQQLTTKSDQRIYRFLAWVMLSPFRYRWFARFQKWTLRRRAGGTGWIKRLPRFIAGWTQIRDLPAPAKKSFHDLWKER